MIRLAGALGSIMFGLLLFVPASFAVWQALFFVPSGPPGNTIRHTFYVVGPMVLGGWQIWVAVGGLAAIGGALVLLGIHFLSPRQTAR